MLSKKGLLESDIDTTALETASCEEPRRRTKLSEARREYLRQYYRKNREKARLYQREYNRLHKRKVRPGNGDNGLLGPREVIRATFTHSDIIKSSPEKAARIIELILSGKRYLCSWRLEQTVN